MACGRRRSNQKVFRGCTAGVDEAEQQYRARAHGRKRYRLPPIEECAKQLFVKRGPAVTRFNVRVNQHARADLGLQTLGHVLSECVALRGAIGAANLEGGSKRAQAIWQMGLLDVSGELDATARPVKPVNRPVEMTAEIAIITQLFEHHMLQQVDKFIGPLVARPRQQKDARPCVLSPFQLLAKRSDEMQSL